MHFAYFSLATPDTGAKMQTMPRLLKARYEELSTETLKQELKELEQERKKEIEENERLSKECKEQEKQIRILQEKFYALYPEQRPAPGSFLSVRIEEVRGSITTATKISIIREILAARATARREDIKHTIKYYIHFALIIGLIYILGTISDTITKNLTGSTQTIASLALVIIPLAIIIYLYCKITKR